MEENIISLKEIFEILKKRWKLILTFTLASALLASISLFLLITPQYETRTKVFIGKEASQKKDYNISDIQMYQKLLKTYAEVIKTEDLIAKSIEAAKLDIKPKEALNNLTVVSVPDTQILELKYKSKSPEEAVKLISSVRDEFIKLSSDLVPNGNVQILEEARFPMRPVSPNKKMGLLIAIILGLMIGIGITFLIEFLDNTYKNKERLEKELNIPVLGTVPNLK
ncbi:Wzz/FepE/Etk N-terminal domain-containing protein [Clostridium sp. UBA1056]|uniref:YveK family protein n=1 Tax=unclassified Clostridium TaxID=2614128 RepID=UPI0032171D26